MQMIEPLQIVHFEQSQTIVQISILCKLRDQCGMNESWLESHDGVRGQGEAGNGKEIIRRTAGQVMKVSFIMRPQCCGLGA